jgi:hypothetical protein
MGQLVQQFTDNFVVAAVALIAVGLGFFSINYLSKRRQMLHQERMASLVKGLHYAGVAQQIFSKPQSGARDHILRGLRWLFGGAGISGALLGYTATQPYTTHSDVVRSALVGVVPGAIGLAHLLFSLICRSKCSNNKNNLPRVMYRAAGRY